MNKEGLAQLLNKRECLSKITSDEAAKAKEAGLVVVLVGQDETVIIEGAMDGKVDCCYDYIYLDVENKKATTLGEAISGNSLLIDTKRMIGITEPMGGWEFETNIPHETFIVYDDIIPFCTGIVFSLGDVGKSEPPPQKGMLVTFYCELYGNQEKWGDDSGGRCRCTS